MTSFSATDARRVHPLQIEGAVPRMPSLLRRWPTALTVVLTIALTGAWSSAAGQEAGTPATIAANRVVELPSVAVGRTYRLHVASSGIGEPASGTPVVYLLDADEDFPLVVALARQLTAAKELPEILIVGVGYLSAPKYYRIRDFTPSVDTQTEQPTGGAANFLRFLETELIPWVEERYRPSPDRVLMGHSLGGLLAVYAAAMRPTLFSGLVASSPSVWWGEGMVIDSIRVARQAPAGRLFTSLGARETDLMSDAWHRLRAALGDKGTPVGALRRNQSLVVDGEGHTSVKPIAFSRGLRWVLSGPRVSPASRLSRDDSERRDRAR